MSNGTTTGGAITAQDALNCCQATKALLQNLLDALASFQDALNALEARIAALETAKAQETDPHWDAWRTAQTGRLPDDVGFDITQFLLDSEFVTTPPAETGTHAGAGGGGPPAQGGSPAGNGGGTPPTQGGTPGPSGTGASDQSSTP